jgi:hypothetical protein
MVRLVAVLERLPVTLKCDLGSWLLSRLAKPTEPSEAWWAVGRIGARVPYYGGIHKVVPRGVAEQWLRQILARNFKKEPQAAFAAVLIARMSGDRDRDLDAGLRQRVVNALKAAKGPESWLGMVSAVRELDEADEKRLFGEALPPGLKLLH